ncbi:CoA transferase [Gordonia sp. NPDC058843]|uniref:CoA transferase n=1 Tax=Gordonia sp. NPDC058843 TaxID=3346648 RepID=UPI003699F350
MDGWVALTLSRQSDLDSVNALLSTDDVMDDPWPVIAAAVRRRDAAEFVERAQLFEIPAAVLGSIEPSVPRVTDMWPRSEPRAPDSELLVVDLSAMWAGPLCGMLLAHRGATVIKVESPDRPDGARAGDPRFFAWMNSSKHFHQAAFRGDTTSLRRLLDVADVVIEASRPRALEQAGLDARSSSSRPGRVWVRITGYGPEHGGLVAFGDDAAVAGGLVGAGRYGPVFCGDAIADPLTGLEAANAVVKSLRRGGGEAIDIAMAEVAATYAALPTVTVTAPDLIEVARPRAPESVARQVQPVRENLPDLAIRRLAEASGS